MNKRNAHVEAGFVSAQRTKKENHTIRVGDAWNATKGITLIALVITIIVLLMLAGVTINLTIGERGIFKTAQGAAKNYTNASERELADLNKFDNNVEEILNGLGEDSGRNDENNGNGNNSEVNNEGSGETSTPQGISITYHANNGTDTIKTEQKQEGEIYKIASNSFSAPNGYSFYGWAISSTSHTKAYSSGEDYSGDEDLDLYVIWKCSGGREDSICKTCGKSTTGYMYCVNCGAKYNGSMYSPVSFGNLYDMENIICDCGGHYWQVRCEVCRGYSATTTKHYCSHGVMGVHYYN